MGWRQGVGGGRGRVERVYRKEAIDTKKSSVAASTTSLGRQFQSLVVLGRKEELLHCVLAAQMSLNCLSCLVSWREAACEYRIKNMNN